MSLTKITLVFLVAFVHSCSSDSYSKKCFHRGCEFSAGLQVKDLKDIIQKNLRDGEQLQNVLNVCTWNILLDEEKTGEDTWSQRRESVCDYIQKMDAQVLGLQEVLSNQLEDLIDCLPEYTYVGGAPALKQGKMNIIFYKRNSGIVVKRSGTFWLSKTPDDAGSVTVGTDEPRICTWTEMTYTMTEEQATLQKPNMFDRILHILKSLTNYKSTVAGKLESTEFEPRVRPNTVTFFVANTHLDWRDVNVARRQINYLQHHLKYQIMDRRRYKVILMGDLNWEDNTDMYEAMHNRKWLQNSMVVSRESFPALTKLDLKTLKEKEFIDYIWQDKFTVVMAATMMDLRRNGRMMSDHRPVVAALLP